MVHLLQADVRNVIHYGTLMRRLRSMRFPRTEDIHRRFLGWPQSLEQYHQEAGLSSSSLVRSYPDEHNESTAAITGRAGRDGLPSDCVSFSFPSAFLTTFKSIVWLLTEA